jgi:hypothetical protein
VLRMTPKKTREQILYERSDSGNHNGMNSAIDDARWLICVSKRRCEWAITWQLEWARLDWAGQFERYN